MMSSIFNVASLTSYQALQYKHLFLVCLLQKIKLFVNLKKTPTTKKTIKFVIYEVRLIFRNVYDFFQSTTAIVERLQNKFSEFSGQINIGSYLGDINLNRYFTYSGSLTVPPCSESVTWTIFQDIIPINPNQVKYQIKKKHTQ